MRRSQRAKLVSQASAKATSCSFYTSMYAAAALRDNAAKPYLAEPSLAMPQRP